MVSRKNEKNRHPRNVRTKSEVNRTIHEYVAAWQNFISWDVPTHGVRKYLWLGVECLMKSSSWDPWLSDLLWLGGVPWGSPVRSISGKPPPLVTKWLGSMRSSCKINMLLVLCCFMCLQRCSLGCSVGYNGWFGGVFVAIRRKAAKRLTTRNEKPLRTLCQSPTRGYRKSLLSCQKKCGRNFCDVTEGEKSGKRFFLRKTLLYTRVLALSHATVSTTRSSKFSSVLKPANSQEIYLHDSGSWNVTSPLLQACQKTVAHCTPKIAVIWPRIKQSSQKQEMSFFDPNSCQQLHCNRMCLLKAEYQISCRKRCACEPNNKATKIRYTLEPACK